MERFKQKKCIAGTLQPGDMTRYEMVAVEEWDTITVIVTNDDFFDKIMFIKSDGRFYKSFRGDKTNPWTIKAAEEMRDMINQLAD